MGAETVNKQVYRAIFAVRFGRAEPRTDFGNLGEVKQWSVLGNGVYWAFGCFEHQGDRSGRLDEESIIVSFASGI